MSRSLCASISSRRRFFFEFLQNRPSELPTEVFVPRVQYPQGYQVSVSDGEYLAVTDRQVLLYRPGPKRDDPLDPDPSEAVRRASSPYTTGPEPILDTAAVGRTLIFS